MTKSGHILVSACLAGYNCRYDGRNALNAELMADLAGQPWMAVCPEQLGGLDTPRTPAVIQGGDGYDVISGKAVVIDDNGFDLTRFFINGAETVLDICLRFKVSRVYLKDRSPSCGVESSRLNGSVTGVCAALLIKAGIEVKEIKSRGRN